MRALYPTSYFFHEQNNHEEYPKLLAIYKMVNEQLFKGKYKNKLYDAITEKLAMHRNHSRALSMFDFIIFMNEKHLYYRDTVQKVRELGFSDEIEFEKKKMGVG
jgi:hypothetical protein